MNKRLKGALRGIGIMFFILACAGILGGIGWGGLMLCILIFGEPAGGMVFFSVAFLATAAFIGAAEE